MNFDIPLATALQILTMAYVTSIMLVLLASRIYDMALKKLQSAPGFLRKSEISGIALLSPSLQLLSKQIHE